MLEAPILNFNGTVARHVCLKWKASRVYLVQERLMPSVQLVLQWPVTPITTV